MWFAQMNIDHKYWSTYICIRRTRILNFTPHTHNIMCTCIIPHSYVHAHTVHVPMYINNNISLLEVWKIKFNNCPCTNLWGDNEFCWFFFFVIMFLFFVWVIILIQRRRGGGRISDVSEPRVNDGHCGAGGGGGGKTTLQPKHLE